MQLDLVDRRHDFDAAEELRELLDETSALRVGQKWITAEPRKESETLTDRCVELLGTDAAGLMLTDQRGGLELMTATLERARLLELQVHEGPCLDCFASGSAITNVDLAEAEVNKRWPAFAPAAVDAGFATTHALPLRLRERVIGALSLFSDQRVQLGDGALAVDERWRTWPRSGCCISGTVMSRPSSPSSCRPPCTAGSLIEQAKCALTARTAVSVNEAFIRMRAYARRNSLTLTRVTAVGIDNTMPTDTLEPA